MRSFVNNKGVIIWDSVVEKTVEDFYGLLWSHEMFIVSLVKKNVRLIKFCVYYSRKFVKLIKNIFYIYEEKNERQMNFLEHNILF